MFKGLYRKENVHGSPRWYVETICSKQSKGVCSRGYVERRIIGGSPMGYVQGGMFKGVCRKEYVRE